MTIVDEIENRQTQPALASGIMTNPPAGIALIQQPKRWPAKCRVPLSVSMSKNAVSPERNISIPDSAPVNMPHMCPVRIRLHGPSSPVTGCLRVFCVPLCRS